MNKAIKINEDITDVCYVLDGVSGLLAFIGEASEDPSSILPGSKACPAFRLLSDMTQAASRVLSDNEICLNEALRQKKTA